MPTPATTKGRRRWPRHRRPARTARPPVPEKALDDGPQTGDPVRCARRSVQYTGHPDRRNRRRRAGRRRCPASARTCRSVAARVGDPRRGEHLDAVQPRGRCRQPGHRNPGQHLPRPQCALQRARRGPGARGQAAASASRRRGRSREARFTSRLLVAESGRSITEVYEATMEPGVRYQAEPHLPGVRESVIVVQGRMRVGPGRPPSSSDPAIGPPLPPTRPIPTKRSNPVPGPCSCSATADTRRYSESCRASSAHTILPDTPSSPAAVCQPQSLALPATMCSPARWSTPSQAP